MIVYVCIANTNNVKYLNINKKGGVYLKTVFFKAKNYYTSD